MPKNTWRNKLKPFCALYFQQNKYELKSVLQNNHNTKKIHSNSRPQTEQHSKNKDPNYIIRTAESVRAFNTLGSPSTLNPRGVGICGAAFSLIIREHQSWEADGEKMKHTGFRPTV